MSLPMFGALSTTPKQLARALAEPRSQFPADETPVNVQLFGDVAMTTPKFQLTMASTIAHYGEEAARRALPLLHMQFRWFDLGRPVFNVNEALLAKLLLTDPANVAPDEIHPPLLTFMVQTPQGFWQIKDNQGVAHDTTKLWFHTYQSVDLDNPSTYITKRSLVDSVWMFYWQLDSTGGISLHERLTAIRRVAEEPDYILSGRPSTLPNWLQYGAGTLQDEVQGLNVTVTDEDKHIQKTIRRLYVNLCLYIAACGKGRKVSRLGGPKRVSKKSVPKPTVWDVGHDVILEPQLVEAAKEWTASLKGHGGTAGWRLKKRSITRGHWRNQVCGVGRKDRKRIWIEPFWRGKKATEQVSRTYQVKSDAPNQKKRHRKRRR